MTSPARPADPFAPPRADEVGRYREALQKAAGLLASYRSSWPGADEVGQLLSRVLAGGAP